MKTMQKGFTLIELVVVIVILGILAATALPKFIDLSKDARISVIKGVSGSMAAANSMIYAKAATAAATGATGSVTINGVAVDLVYGFAKDGLEIAKAMDLNPATDFAVTAATINHAKAPVPATCGVTYTPATATTAPAYPFTDTTFAGC